MEFNVKMIGHVVEENVLINVQEQDVLLIIIVLVGVVRVSLVVIDCLYRFNPLFIDNI